ncbi:WhiB family transcriptional regulator [Streptomyces sp. NBC_01077]|uniref:WhiB family transcriptional regulator n=1 Tax=Streptomyces sp. NBC_01077 TaxID=2903746 RepID=UPI00386C6D8C|nr:WhiB family transcriptional regulator [Streptomyces sp. NBC_01077]
MTTKTPASGMPTPLPGAGTNWRTRGLCRDEDPELFFPDTAADRRAALAVCARCPVRERCLAEALAEEGGRNTHGRHGIRGGTTPTGRQKLHSRTAKTAT